MTKCFRLEKCKVMTSKKRPLWLVWNNAEYEDSKIAVLYKTGDGKKLDLFFFNHVNSGQRCYSLSWKGRAVAMVIKLALN